MIKLCFYLVQGARTPLPELCPHPYPYLYPYPYPYSEPQP